MRMLTGPDARRQTRDSMTAIFDTLKPPRCHQGLPDFENPKEFASPRSVHWTEKVSTLVSTQAVLATKITPSKSAATLDFAGGAECRT